jgi:cyclase
MQRRSFLKTSGFTLGSLALFGHESLAALLADPAYKITMLSEKTGIFTEKGGTILFRFTKEGIVVVDAQFPDTAAHLVEELKKKSTDPFRLLINTHHHQDHTSGNIAFKDLVPHVLAHANSKANQEKVAIKNQKESLQLYPDQVYTNIWCESIRKEKICLYYFGAGHTNGDSWVHFEKENIVHTGDLLFNRRHPNIDKSAGANIANWITNLETAVGTFSRKTKYVCGHAGTDYDVVCKKEDLLAFRDYLKNVLIFTEAAIKSGFTKQEFLKSTEIPGSPEWKGSGIEKPLIAAWEEMNGG